MQPSACWPTGAGAAGGEKRLCGSRDEIASKREWCTLRSVAVDGEDKLLISNGDLAPARASSGVCCVRPGRGLRPEKTDLNEGDDGDNKEASIFHGVTGI